MKKLVFLAIYVIIMAYGCTPTKYREEIEPIPIENEKEILDITKQFFSLSAQKDIDFLKKVPISYVSVKNKNVIAYCSISSNDRGIYIDRDNWKDLSEMRKKITLFHEMVHCYCDRGHDFGDGKWYEDSLISQIIHLVTPYNKANGGYFPDRCPVSIMYPFIVKDGCYVRHYSHYVEEMFDRCVPY